MDYTFQSPPAVWEYFSSNDGEILQLSWRTSPAMREINSSNEGDKLQQ